MDEYKLKQAVSNAGEILEDEYLKAQKLVVRENSIISEFKVDPKDTTFIRGLAPTTIRTPAPYEFIRTLLNMDDIFRCNLFEDQEGMGSTFYITSPLIASLMPRVIKLYALQIAITNHGDTFIWPLKTHGVEKGNNSWNCSAWNAATIANYKWVKVMSSTLHKQWEILKADDDIYPDPLWPTESYEEILEGAFADKIIKSIDDPVIRKFRGKK